MKKYLVTLLLVAVCLIAGCNKKPDSYDSQGQPISLSAYKGKWVVVNYWAKWCKPCVKELPDLNSAFVANKDQVIVLGVSYDPLSNDEINQFANKLGVTFPMLATFPMDKWGINEINVLPETFVFSPQGKLVKTLMGPQTRASLEAAMGFKVSA